MCVWGEHHRKRGVGRVRSQLLDPLVVPNRGRLHLELLRPERELLGRLDHPPPCATTAHIRPRCKLGTAPTTIAQGVEGGG